MEGRARRIRPLAREDIPQVVSLYEHVARSGSHAPPPGLAGYFERTFLDYPGADPEIPSLVYFDDEGKIAGFLGSSVRRLRFDDRTIRLGVSGQVVTEPRIRTRAAGAFLMREYLSGQQDLTVTDTASHPVRRIWEGIGGDTFELACVGWVRIFRPLRFAGDYLSRGRSSDPVAATRPVWEALDSLSARLPLPFSPKASDGASEDLTPSALVEQLASLPRSIRLRPAYNEEFATWLFAELAAVRSRGELIARLVRSGTGEVQGWFVYHLRAGGIGQVLQVAARGREVGDVLDELFRDARARGAGAVQGRLEPHLLEPLSERRCLFHAAGYLALLHSDDAELLQAVQSSRGLLTRLDGEWWMGHHLEPFA